MLLKDGAGSDSAATESGARKIVGTGKRDVRSFKPQNPETQLAIRAELTGSDTCSAAGLTVQAAAPVLVMCRQLLGAGHDPRRPLHAYRGNVLALVVRSIGEAAKLTVKTMGNGAPGFAIEGMGGRATAPSMRKSAGVA